MQRLLAIGITLFLLVLLLAVFTVLLPSIIAMTMNVIFLFPVVLILVGLIYGIIKIIECLMEE